MPAKTLVELSELTKTYGPTLANDQINLTIASGEVIGLVGGNGAGKSTLMKMLCGEVMPDSGSIVFPSETDTKQEHDTTNAQKRGIRTVHQELSLCDNLTVAENFYLESPEGAHPIPGWRQRYRERARAALNTIFPDSAVDVDAKVADLLISQRQMTEIARALSTPGGEIIILDEPTSSLTLDRSKQLQRYIVDNAREGRSFVFISHKLQEIRDVSTRTVVMRNGSTVWDDATDVSSINMVVSLMGGDTESRRKPRTRESQVPTLEQTMAYVTGHGSSEHTDKIALKAGEIVGLAGLEGNGQKELLHSIFEPSVKPGVRLEQDATVSFVSGDRQREGVFPLWDVLQNIFISRIVKRPGLSLVNQAKEEEAVKPAAEHILLDATRFHSGINELSGGNQQKALVARALACDTQIILLDDPTRGVDVAAKQDFYTAIKDIAREGKLVVWYSTEDLEFIECNRVLILSDGTITHELVNEDISESAIVDASFEHIGQSRESVEQESRDHKTGLSELFVRSAPFISLAIVLAIMGWVNPLSMTTFGLNLLLFPAIALILVSFGQMFIIGGSEIDLGAGPFAALVNVLSATLLVSAPFIGVGAIVAVLVAYSGLGALIQLRRIPAIVVTLGASFVWIGLGYTIQPAPGGSSPAWLAAITSVSFPLVPTPIVFIVFFTLVAWMVNQSPLGVTLRGFGNSPQAMAQSGWSPALYATIRYLISGLFLIVAGLMLTSINHASDINSGNSFTLLSVAAVIIGGSTLFGGYIYPTGVAAGAVALSLIGALLVMLSVKSDYNAAVQGLLLLLILAFRAMFVIKQGKE